MRFGGSWVEAGRATGVRRLTDGASIKGTQDGAAVVGDDRLARACCNSSGHRAPGRSSTRSRRSTLGARRPQGWRNLQITSTSNASASWTGPQLRPFFAKPTWPAGRPAVPCCPQGPLASSLFETRRLLVRGPRHARPHPVPPRPRHRTRKGGGGDGGTGGVTLKFPATLRPVRAQVSLPPRPRPPAKDRPPTTGRSRRIRAMSIRGP